MRFYSDELKKFFDTQEQCLAAEEKARIDAEEKNITKAKLAKEINDAEKLVDDAYEELELAKKQVCELQKEYDEKVDSIMTPAVNKVTECTKIRAEAIKKFNDNYGVYTTTYTGNKALNEYLKIDNMMNQLWKKFYW